MPEINAAGLNLIKTSEGCSLKAYPDPGTGGEPWTIGYGHTGNVKPGQTITQAQAEEFLKLDLRTFEDGVSKLVTHSLTPNQFAALVSFSYNVGLGNLKSSTLLKDVNAGKNAEAVQEFCKWTKAAGKVLPGLVRRREAEAKLYAQA